MLSPETIEKLSLYLSSRLGTSESITDALAHDIDEFLDSVGTPVSPDVLYQTLEAARDEQFFALRTRTKGTGDWADGISTQATHTLEILNRALAPEFIAPELMVSPGPLTYPPLRPRPILLLDVDGVINLIEKDNPIRPGIALVCQIWSALGGEVVLWSGPGPEHAEAEAERAGITQYISRYLEKPDYPMTEERALLVLGAVPVLQVDDDPSERISHWPFLHLPIDPVHPALLV